MPTIPCPDKISCPCEDSPFANLSAEAPDLPTFFSLGFVRQTPPLGTAWQQFNCFVICESTVSQEAADLCAQEQAFLCAVGTWQFGGVGVDSGPVPPPVTTRATQATPTFRNFAQTAGVNCPDGLTFFLTVPSGIFAGLSQADADKEAQTYALRQAQLRRLCLSSITTPACVNVPYTTTITASSKFLAVAPQTDFWELVSGTLPPGLTFNGGNLMGGQATITGTPTTTGTYFFIIQVTDPRGDSMAKGYSLVIAGITNANTLPNGTVGANYSTQLTAVGFTSPVFTLASGALPDGLSLSASGIISGTPTTAGTSNMTFLATQGSLACMASGSITVVAGGLNWNDLVWNNPVTSGPVAVGTGFITSFSNAGHLFDADTGVTGAPGGFVVLGNRGDVPYDGPLVNCNAHVVILVSIGPVGAHNIIVRDSLFNIYLLQDIGALAVGAYDFPFVIPALVLETLSVTWDGSMSNGAATRELSYTVSLTPFV